MRLTFKNTGLASIENDMVIFLFAEDDYKLTARPELAELKPLLGPILEAGEFKADYLAELPLRLEVKGALSWLYVVGLGPKGKLTNAKIVEASAKASQMAQMRKAKHVNVLMPPLCFGYTEDLLDNLSLGVLLSFYRQTTYKSEAPEKRLFKEVTFYGQIGSEKTAKTILDNSQIAAKAICLARDLANMPGNFCYPESFAAEAVKLAGALKLKTTIWDEQEMAQKGAGAHLAVGQGSSHPPRMLIIQYQGAKTDTPPVALVGKGVTFDSGGICLKVAAGMEAMKTDMSGAANVLAVTLAAAEMKLPVNLVTVIPLAENMPDGNSYRPGDVLKSLSGKMVEVINTDAEGRLLLADGLTLAQEYKPSMIIDMATLTGACVVALGQLCAGLFSTNLPLQKDIMEAAELAGERLWPLPFIDDYEEDLKSETGDFAHIATQTGGAVNAALFLRKFVEAQTPWAHIDIAGPSRAAKARPGTPVGGTAFGVRSVLRFLEKKCCLR